MKLTTAQPVCHPQPTTRALAFAYLVFDRPDLERAERLLNDSGLMTMQRNESTLLLHGTSPVPLCYVVRKASKAAFTGFGLQMTGRAALDALMKLPDALTVEPLDWPSGGYRVRLVDPSGFRVDAVADQAPATELPHRSALSLNSVDAPLRINETQRPPVGTPEVIRLGHVVLEPTGFQATYVWYTQHFGLIPSDVQVLSDGLPVVAFMWLDLDDTPADHHTFVLAQGFMSRYSHSAFELIDADTVGMGYHMLCEQGWKHAWRLGRHTFRSQIFDYWQDPWGNRHEHYYDGDLFTADQSTGIHPVSREAMSQRGQSAPASFTKPKLAPAAIAALICNLRRSPDLTLRELAMLTRIFA